MDESRRARNESKVDHGAAGRRERHRVSPFLALRPLNHIPVDVVR
jgi:hypothetical protein